MLPWISVRAHASISLVICLVEIAFASRAELYLRFVSFSEESVPLLPVAPHLLLYQPWFSRRSDTLCLHLVFELVLAELLCFWRTVVIFFDDSIAFVVVYAVLASIREKGALWSITSILVQAFVEFVDPVIVPSVLLVLPVLGLSQYLFVACFRLLICAWRLRFHDVWLLNMVLVPLLLVVVHVVFAQYQMLWVPSLKVPDHTLVVAKLLRGL